MSQHYHKIIIKIIEKKGDVIAELVSLNRRAAKATTILLRGLNQNLNFSVQKMSELGGMLSKLQ